MQYTNKTNLPPEFFGALTKQRYSGGATTDYSVTTLKQPPRITQLTRRHDEELTTDAVDNLWSLMGTLAHNLLEEHGSEDSVTEQRMYTEVLGRQISGQVDHYKDQIITDYKVTSAWTLVYGSRIKEWEEQLNTYAYLFRKHNFPVRQIRIITVLRDWDKNKAAQGGNYPNSAIQIIPITLWSLEEQEQHVFARTALHMYNETKSDTDLDPCSPEEMWEQPNKYAVMQEGKVRATRVFDSEEEALAYVDGTGLSTYSVVKRQGKRTRCEEYCACNSFCNIYQNYLKEKEL